MRYETVVFIFFFTIMTLPITAISYADTLVLDPQIPNGERITYKVTVGDETYTLIKHTVRTKENGRELYETRSSSKEDDTIVRIDRETMAVVYSKNTSKKKDYSVERITTTLRNDIPRQPDELVIIDFSGLDQLFRGFPFETLNSLTIHTAGSGDFTMVVKKKKKEETIKTPLGDIPCYELELKMTGFWGTFMPKTYFWYSVEAPYYLVKYIGQEGSPGSPKMIIQVTGYEGK